MGRSRKSNCSCASTSPKPLLHGSSRSRPPPSSTLSTRVSCSRHQARGTSPSCTRISLVWGSMKLYVPLFGSTELSETEFATFILPHLSMPKRGPKCKLGYHRVFNLILWVLYTG